MSWRSLGPPVPLVLLADRVSAKPPSIKEGLEGAPFSATAPLPVGIAEDEAGPTAFALLGVEEFTADDTGEFTETANVS